MPRDVTDYRLLIHDTADQIFRIPWPPTRQGFIDSFITPYADSAGDAYCFCVNCSGTLMFYDSDVVEPYGHDRDYFYVPSALRQHEVIKRLCAAGDAPPRVAVEAARAAGMDCFLRLRMNDLHDRFAIDGNLDKPGPGNPGGEPCYMMTAFRRVHPELLLGDPWAGHGKFSRGYWESLAFNYALQPVRELFYRLAEELVTRYEPDGLQLDFLRFPIFFKQHEAWGQRHLLTDLVRRIRACAEEVARRCGHRILLVADVPETVESALRAGIDTPTWLGEGLVDMVTLGRGYAPFSSPWGEVTELATKAGIPAIACFNHGKIAGWGRGDDRQFGRQTLRAAVHRSLAAGAQGVFLFNHFYQTADYAGTHFGEACGMDFTHDLTDRDALAAATRTYELARAMDVVDTVRYAHCQTAWQGQVPMTIGLGGQHTAVFDLQAVAAVTQARLWLQLSKAHFDDEIEFRWNDVPLTVDPQGWAGARLFDSFDYHFDVPSQALCEGENRLAISLRQRDARLDPFVTLAAGHVTLGTEPSAAR